VNKVAEPEEWQKEFEEMKRQKKEEEKNL